MAIDYTLYLAGSTPAEVVAQWAFPELADRPTGVAAFLAAELYEKYGFDVVVTPSSNAYIEVSTDTGDWEWEPDVAVLVRFRLDAEADRLWATDNMLVVVRRLLAAVDEDAALVLNGDVLILARIDGVLTKHRRDTWWTSSPAANQLIPG